ncbi:hypothetical protein L226DRAFT_436751, partial [Lentinus tigrinus ALCF2SS1-7]
GHWSFFFRCHAIGTKVKKYDTLEWTQLGYDPALEDPPTDEVPFSPNPYDNDRVQSRGGKKFSPLLRRLSDGPVSVASRGKELLVAAGYHAVRIHLGLEASVFVVSLQDFEDLTAQCQPGPNKDRVKAKRLRSFTLPRRFIVPGCPAFINDTDRYINIFAAVVCQDCAIIVTDFSRLVRLHVVSLPQIWTADDIKVGSKHWSALWDEDHGPDWVTETRDALQRVEQWRLEVTVEPQATAARSPLFVSLCKVQTVFNGLGKHTANDFLHLLGLWPGMPTIDLCSDEATFTRFLSVLVPYMGLWSSDRFLQLVAPPANHPNPFAFNYRSHRNYISNYVHVYRKSFVHVSPQFYNQLLVAGLLDPSHTISNEYDSSTVNPTSSTYKILPVFVYTLGSVKFYSVIRARRPAAWQYALNDQQVYMRRLANNTTVGIASFREMVEN